MAKTKVLILAWMPDGVLRGLMHPGSPFEFVDAREEGARERHLKDAIIAYGLPPVPRLADAPNLRWLQLISAGVPLELCPAAQKMGLTVTNLAGLYGNSIAEHALCLMLMLARNLHLVLRNQRDGRWDRDVAKKMSDLHGRTVAILGLGSIGQGMARLARACGMRVLGCRRTDRPASFVDRLYAHGQLHEMLAEADYVAVAAPLTVHTQGMLGAGEFAAMKPGVFYVNVSRGGVAQEKALLAALESGHLAGAGLDVFESEPLAADHPFWQMPQVIVSPHYSGETINTSSLPAERFRRNLHAWSIGQPLEGMVDLEWGY